MAPVALLAVGGAARRPEGVALALPPWPLAATLLAMLGVIAARLGLRAGAPGLGLLVVLPIPLIGLWVPGALALTGPPLLALVLGCLVFILWREGLAHSGRWLVPTLLLVYVGVAERVHTQVGAEGDEPHYLMVAESLVRDGDLALGRDFQEERYRAFTPRHLDPHYRVRGKRGEIFSLHAVGLSILILPAYALGGSMGASFFMALLAALLAHEIRELVRGVTDSPRLAEGVAWVVGLSPPLISYAGLIFTEIPAALVVAVVLRRAARRESHGPWLPLLLGTMAAVLPWLNVRYSIITVILVAFVWVTRRRLGTALALLAPLVVSAAALALYHKALYGFWDPRRVYGTRPELAWATLIEGLPGLLFDQEFGLLVYAPVFVLAPLGLTLLWRRHRALTAACAGIVVAVTLVAGSWHMWRGGFNPPARFLVPLLPILALGAAAWLRRGPSVGAALLMGWSLWVGLAGGLEPRLVHRDRDGTAPFFRTYAGAYEWTHILPSYVLPPTPQAYDRAYADRHGLLLVWLVALGAAAALPRIVRAPAQRLSAGTAGLTLATAIAGLVSTGRSEGRDAVRLVGREALTLPRLQRARDARWDTTSLRWGPSYEPRRTLPAVLGDRLPLPPGAYEITIDAERAPGTTLATLIVREEKRPGRARESSSTLEPGTSGLTAQFVVATSTRAVTLELRDGSALRVHAVRLVALQS